ncbi:MAG: hypothetical protein H7Z17_11885 [Fuerstia sp.]|nr:hypothetical protein [Fuerstiella sp.]
MKIFDTRPGLLLAGLMAILASGCITGTNTFSNASVPTTRYCSIDDTPAPIFDIPAAAERTSVMINSESSDASGDKVSLVP